MLDTNTLKAGDWITRISNGGALFTVGKSYELYNTTSGLSFYTDNDSFVTLSSTCPDFWSKSDSCELLKERTPTLEESLQEAVDAGFQEAMGQNSKTIKHLPMLLGYLKQHGIVAWYDYDDSKLFCYADYYDTVEKESFDVLEEVEPTLKAVREFLGY
jgi:hypothetical protein